jgi:hypothetical protein
MVAKNILRCIFHKFPLSGQFYFTKGVLNIGNTDMAAEKILDIIQVVSLAIGPKVFLITFKVFEVI